MTRLPVRPHLVTARHVTANPTVTRAITRVLLDASLWAQASSSREHGRGEACKAGGMTWKKTNQGQTR